MITNKQKWLTIAVFTVFALACTMLSLFKPNKESNFSYDSISQLQGHKIGGIVTKMPGSSAKIFLDGYFGVSFSSYLQYDDFETALAALDNRSVSAIWVSDVTAKYLARTGNYRYLVPKETPGGGEERLEFAFAFRPTDTALRDKMNEMLATFKENGMTDKLYSHFVNGTESDCLCSASGSGKTLYVGITGAVPPLEEVDSSGNVSGMAVELAKYLGVYTDLNVKFVVLDNETAFAKLMGGKVDVIACYGTSENHSTEFPEYIMSDGYCSMKNYCLLVNK